MALKGCIPWNKGIKLSEEHRKKISLSLIGKPSRALGKHWKIKDTSKMGKYWKGKKKPEMSGEKHWKWIKDRTMVKQYWTERNNPEYRQWVKECKKRDNYKCKINNCSCKGRLEVHHILSWHDFPDLRYDINNGITLCQAHHPRKREDEIKLIQTFTGLVMQKK